MTPAQVDGSKTPKSMGHSMIAPRAPRKVDSITLCYYMAPYNLAIFSVASAAVEGVQPVRPDSHFARLGSFRGAKELNWLVRDDAERCTLLQSQV